MLPPLWQDFFALIRHRAGQRGSAFSREVARHRRQDLEDPAAVGLEGVHQALEVGGIGRHDAAVAPLHAPAVCCIAWFGVLVASQVKITCAA